MVRIQLFPRMAELDGCRQQQFILGVQTAMELITARFIIRSSLQPTCSPSLLFKNLNISAGNSIVYSDENVNPAYLIPLFFYKSVDHSMTSGINNMNSQMFFDISSRQIKNLHLYATMFIDELATSRFSKNDEWNFFSYKAGFRLTNLPVNNLSFTTEFTYTYPLAFQHYVPTLTFQNAGYNLGHYMKDNSQGMVSCLRLPSCKNT